VPSISGVDGPTTLRVGQSGTWSVKVKDASGYLSYSVRWGDEVSPFDGTSAMMAPWVGNSGTFTHTYANAGTYTPTFTVTNGNGKSATASATVVVGGTTSQTFSATPDHGSVPLTVTFYTYISRDWSHRYTITIDHGDGSSQHISECGPSVDLCGGGGQNTHTYASAGTYTAKLTKTVYNNCSAGQICAAWDSREEVIGTVTVTVY